MTPSRYSQTRRLFLKKSIALGAAGMAPLVYQLEAMAAAAAQHVDSRVEPKATHGALDIAAAAPNYKALVCLFMFGGNDNANFVIPYDLADYNTYAAARSNVLAIPRTGDPTLANVNLRGLIPIGPLANQGNRTLAFHPNVGKNNVNDPSLFRSDGIPWLWDSGKLALIGNVGALGAPTTLSQYNNKTVPLPRNLFSHSDQQDVWMTNSVTSYSSTGVAGRIADLVDSMNMPAAGVAKIATCISIAGPNAFQVSKTTPSYQMLSSGPQPLSADYQYYPQYTNAAQNALNAAVNGAYVEQYSRRRDNLLQAQWAGMMKYSQQTFAALNSALAGNPLPGAATFRIGGNPLSQQLQMVAKMINASAPLGLARQIFFVQIGGFDVHGSEFHPQNNANWNHISEAVYDFYHAMTTINAASQVTLFSASDFGRTLDTNSSGTDHGWGGHHFVTGGAVAGQQMYGTFPVVAKGTPTDVTRGILLPTTSTDQYYATLAKWFGLSDSDIATVLPNLAAFSPANLGFI